MRRLASSTRFFLIATPAALLLLLAGFVFFRAQHELSSAARAAVLARQVPFRVVPLDVAAAAAANPGFVSVAAPAGYSSGAVLAGELYLAGPGGLSLYSSTGVLRATLRTGIELPVAPITALATGRLRGAREPQLLMATAGAGLLLLTPGTGAPALSQMLPGPAGAQDMTALLPLPGGDLLLGTRHSGLLLFSGEALTPLRVELPGLDAAKLDVTALAATGNGSFLLGTRNAGLLYAHGGTWTRADVHTGMPDDDIESIAVAGATAFAGTPLGVAEFDLNAPAFRPARTLAPGMFAHALQVTPDGLMVGTLEEGVRDVSLRTAGRLRNASIRAPMDSQDAGLGGRIDAFLPAPGALYALSGGALLEHTRSGWSSALPAPATTLADRNISALVFAPDGSLYVGFFDHGLDILAPGAAAPPRHFEDDSLFCINRLAVDPVRHTVAAATADGLVLFDASGTPRQTLTRRDGLLSDHVTDIAWTASGPVLATPAGLTFLTASGAESLYAFQGLVNNHVYTLAVSPGANGAPSELLAGTLGGLSVLQGGQVRRSFTATDSGLRHNWITALLPTGAGAYLVGTYGAGLETLAPGGVFTPVDLPAGVPHDLVINPNALLATATHIYAGTLAHGMLVYTLATGRWRNVTEGLPSRNVTAFAARAGGIYVGTENGLVRIEEARL